MSMAPREVVRRTVRFEGADRIPYALAPRYGSDFEGVGMAPSPDARPPSGVDKWGCEWENMRVDLLGQRFGGRIAFWCPVDIQANMVHGSLDDIRAYCRRLVTTLGRPDGGFIAKWYGDPIGAGHRPEAIDAMCEEFLRLSRAHGSRDLSPPRPADAVKKSRRP
jgi:hypothetical protein